MKLNEIIRRSLGVDPGCSFDFRSKKVHDQVQAVAQKLEAKYGTAELCGRNRVVFMGKNVVIKLPRNDTGIDDNISEARHYKLSPEKDRLARSRLLDVDGIPVIIMIKVDIMKTLADQDKKPDWATFFDCAQVGLTKNCKWRAYDYGGF